MTLLDLTQDIGTMKEFYQKLEMETDGDEEQDHKYWWDEILNVEPSEAKERVKAEIANRIITLEGHNGSIRSTAYSNKRREVYSGSFDSSIRIWDLNSSQIRHSMIAHVGGVNALAYNSQMDFLASGGAEGEIKVWNLDSYELMHEIPLKTGGVWSIKFNRLQTLMIVSGEGTALIWHAEKHHVLYRFINEPQVVVFCAVMAPDDSMMYTGHQGHYIRSWDTGDTGQPKHTFYGHSNAITSLAVHSSHTILFSASLDSTIRVWKLETNNCIRILQDTDFGINCIILTPNEDFLFAAGGDSIIRKYQMNRDMACALKMKGHSSEIYSICLGERNELFSGSLDMSIKGWNTQNGDIIHNFEGHSEGVTKIICDDNDELMYSAGMENTIKIWNIEQRRCLYILSGHSMKISDMVLNDLKDTLYSSSYDATIRVWKLKDGKKCSNVLTAHTGPVTALGYAPKHRILCSAGVDKLIFMWDLRTLEPIAQLDEHQHEILTLHVNFNSTQLFSAGIDKTIKIWSFKSKKCIDNLYGHEEAITKILSSRGKMDLFTSSKDKTIRVWNTEERTCKYVLKGHKEEVSDIALSRDVSMVFSSSLDNTIKVWDLATGNCINTLYGHTHALTSLYTMKKQNTIISGSLDRSIKIWKMVIPTPSNEFMDPTCKSAHSKATTNIHLVHDGTVLITTSEDETIKFWNLSKRSLLKIILTHSAIVASCVDANEKLLYTCHLDCTCKVIDIYNFSLLKKFEMGHEPLSCMQISNSRDFLLSAVRRTNYSVQFTHIPSESMVRELNGHKLPISCMIVNDDDKYLFTGGLDKNIIVWNVFELSLKYVLKGHSEPITALCLGTNDSLLFSGSADRTIRVWSLIDFKLITTLMDHHGEITAIRTNIDENILFTAAKDQTMKIWSTINYELLESFDSEDSDIRAIAITKDTQIVYTGHYNGTIRAWDFHTLKSCKGLDMFTLEAVMGYLMAESMYEKEVNLRSMISCLSHSNNAYYIQRVYPQLFLASMSNSFIFGEGLRAFGYPNLVFNKYESLIYRVLKDEVKNRLHLDTLCDYLCQNSDRFIIHWNIIDKLVQNITPKVEKLLIQLFEKKVEPQQGSYLKRKACLMADPMCLSTQNTRFICELDQDKLFYENYKDAKDIEYFITRFPVDFRNGSLCSRNFFRNLEDCSKELLLSDYKYLINYKWERLYMFIFIHAMGFWTLIAFMSYHLVFKPDSLPLTIICLLLNLIYIVYELACAWGELLNHITRDMNWLDLLCMSVNIVVLGLNYINVNPTLKFAVVVFDILFYFFRGITYLRIFDQTRYLISMILKVFSDIVSFVAIMFIIIIAVSLISINVSALKGETPESFGPYFSGTYLLILGSFDTSNFNDVADWVFFMLRTICMTLVLLNLLIAIISNAYEEVKERKEFFDIKEKLSIISDFENFMSKILRRISTIPHYKYQIVAFYSEKESGQEIVEHLVDKVEVMEDRLKDKMRSIISTADLNCKLIRGMNRKVD